MTRLTLEPVERGQVATILLGGEIVVFDRASDREMWGTLVFLAVVVVLYVVLLGFTPLIDDVEWHRAS
jgi:hypothetical protein